MEIDLQFRPNTRLGAEEIHEREPEGTKMKQVLASDYNPTESPVPLKALLTPTASLEGHGLEGLKQQNFLTKILSLFKSVRPGSDLTRFQLPPQFNLPKSQLQLFGEMVYCYSQDLLSKCAQGTTPVERFIAVVAWGISMTRPPVVGKAPYNPILGETHHVSNGDLNVLLEQVSHHPPVSALHATNEAQKLELNWWLSPQPYFYGRSVETTVHGQRELKLLAFNESYEMNCPSLRIHLLPFPAIEWVGNVEISCKQSGLKATLSYPGKSLLGLRGSPTKICGRIVHCLSGQDMHEIEGNWDDIVRLKDLSTGTTSVLYDAKQVISSLRTPMVQDEQGLARSESAVVWADVSEGIFNGDWGAARKAKTKVEEHQRHAQRARDIGGTAWIPKHFTKRGDVWDYVHHPRIVPPAPIVIP